jgi:riboflavin synthase
VLDVKVPPAVMRYVVAKGSIAVDGISLTVAEMGKSWIRIWIIPHTRKITNLVGRRTGDRVNLEADVLGKYIDKLLGSHRKRRR